VTGDVNADFSIYRRVLDDLPKAIYDSYNQNRKPSAQ
jgi:hypothetical protein